jgi:hypothetical protein
MTLLKNSDSMKLLVTSSLTNYLGKCNHKESRKNFLKQTNHGNGKSIFQYSLFFLKGTGATLIQKKVLRSLYNLLILETCKQCLELDSFMKQEVLDL